MHFETIFPLVVAGIVAVTLLSIIMAIAVWFGLREGME